MLSWLIVISLIAANALYVAAEFAAVSLHVSRLKPLAEEGNEFASRLLYYLEDGHRLDRFIAACQVGITWSSLVLGAFGQATFGPPFAEFLRRAFGAEESASALSFGILLVFLTVTQMVFGELVPKSLALHNPLRVGLITVYPMRWSLILYSWFINILNGSGFLLLRVLGQSPTGHRHVHSPEELGLLLKESGKSGQLAKHEEERLQGALKLSRRPVKQLMTPRVRIRTLPRDISPETLLKEILQNPFTRIPVTDEDGDAVLGLVYTQDVLNAYVEGAMAPSLSRIMRPVLFVPEQMTADKLYVFLREHSAHIVMVVDEFGSVSGLVTLDDLMSEMLGDMPDEFKQAETKPEPLPDGRVRYAGLTRIDDVEAFQENPWTGEAATLGGVVLETLGHMPAPGEKVKVAGIELEVERIEGNAISFVLVRPRFMKEVEDA